MQAGDPFPTPPPAEGPSLLGPSPFNAESAAGSSLALIAHDHKKAQLIDFAICYLDILSRRRLIATMTTGRMLREMAGLEVELMRSGLDGGDREIARMVVARRVAAVIFLVDPFTRRPHEPGLDPVLRACSLWDIPLATNISTAHAVLNSLAVLEAGVASAGALLEDK